MNQTAIYRPHLQLLETPSEQKLYGFSSPTHCSYYSTVPAPLHDSPKLCIILCKTGIFCLSFVPIRLCAVFVIPCIWSLQTPTMTVLFLSTPVSILIFLRNFALFIVIMPDLGYNNHRNETKYSVTVFARLINK